MKKYFFALFAFSIIILSNGCKKSVSPPADLGYDYYPTEIGTWVEYEVDSITFSDIALPMLLSDTSTYQIREVIESSYLDNEGRETYRIERYRRDHDTLSWTIDRIWSMNVTATNLQKKEDELRFIKFVFPPRNGESWDGNSYIDSRDNYQYLENWVYEMEDVGDVLTVNGQTFDESVTIMHIDEENLIEKNYSVEQYAKGVGMVYKEFQKLEKQDVTADWSRAEKGVIIRYKVKAYGQ